MENNVMGMKPAKNNKKKKNVIRTFRFSEALIKELGILRKAYNIERTTFIRMAIYHGIENINNGYCPYRNHNLKKLNKEKYKISLPKETWNYFIKAMDSIQYKLEEHIPDGEVIEMFIRMEIKSFLSYQKKIANNDNLDDYKLFEERNNTTINITASVPKILYDKFQNEIKRTGSTEKKIGSYIITKALLYEKTRTAFSAIDTDADLIKLIDNYGFNRLKAIEMLKTLIQANKIILLNDNNIDS